MLAVSVTLKEESQFRTTPAVSFLVLLLTHFRDRLEAPLLWGFGEDLS